MRMMPQPMPPMMLRNGSMSSWRPRDEDASSSLATVGSKEDDEAESSVDCFSGKWAVAPWRGFGSPSTVCSVEGTTEEKRHEEIIIGSCAVGKISSCTL